jgi:hypothetical protein
VEGGCVAINSVSFNESLYIIYVVVIIRLSHLFWLSGSPLHLLFYLDTYLLLIFIFVLIILLFYLPY